MLGFLYRAILYVLPVAMGGMEMQLNEVAHKSAEAATLLAPSLAAAAVGLFLPLARPSPYPPAGIKKSVDEYAAGVALLGLLGGLYVWHMLVATNLGAPMDFWVPEYHIPHLTRGGTVAIAAYSFAALLTEVKLFVEK